MQSSTPDSAPTGRPGLQVVRALWPAVWANKRRVGIALGLLILSKLVMVAVPLLLKFIVDELSAPVQPFTIPIFLLLGYALLRFLGGLFGEIRDLVFTPVAEQVVADFRARVFEHLHRLGPRFHGSRQTGALTRDVERGSAGIGFLLGTALFTVLPTLIEILTATGIMTLGLNLWFSAIVAATLIAYTITTVTLTNRRTPIQRRLNEIDSEAGGRLVDSLLNQETVKFYTNEPLELKRFRDILRRRIDVALANQRSLSTLHISQSAVIALGVGAVMVLAGREVVSGTMTVGSLVLVNAYIIQIVLPLNTLAFIFRQTKDALIDTERIFTLLAQRPDEEHAPDTPLALQHGDVRFEGVNFGYEPSRQILWDINFHVPAGNTLALVGGSGSGKSTIARLLFRFYRPDSGRILVDGQPIDEVNERSLRNAIGIVPQDTLLFNDTIAYNIAYGRPGATLSEVIDAARAARIHEFIDALPQQYDTLVGERGVKLSGGERQRIAIARAILKNPPILVFDEATSALDTLAERAIQSELDRLSANRTTLIIAHRLSTVVDADEILVMDQGKIVERGKHDDLVRRDGMYAHMWKLQRQQSELERTARQLSRQPVNLLAIVAGVLDSVRPLMESRDIDVYTAMDERARRVTGDPSALQEAISEIVSNALAVTPVRGRIALRLDVEDGDSLLSISDGRTQALLEGASDEERATIASPVHDPLQIRALVEEQGGQLSHHPSRSGEGHTYVLRMPLRAVDEPAQRNRESPPARPRERALNGVRVMAVDDQPDVLQVVAAVLEAHGATVTARQSGEQTLADLRALPSAEWPDVLVCDLSLEDIDGYQVLQEIRKIESDRDTSLSDLMPAIALTGRAGSQHRMRALLAGFQVHLAKPVEPGLLVTTIAELAQRGHGPHAALPPPASPPAHQP